ncbi:MAG: class I SAM-dependent methyltransferase [Acidimicrobiia bacterium]|nr:class I SAM-dependent methyltransferase [Acidimicrobiia bacterium]
MAEMPGASLEDETGLAHLTCGDDGTTAITVTPKLGRCWPVRSWTTRYPRDLIEHVFAVKGASHLCDEIRRHEDPTYVEHHLRWDIGCYSPIQAFTGARVLDFGCGAGSSTLVLARLFPGVREIVGVELVSEHVELARHRADYFGLHQVRFAQSPDGSKLPTGIGEFDFVVLSAVYEHLLPDERPVVLELVWSHLKPGGILFLDQTPNRLSPIERHTTGLPLLNYMPRPVVERVVRRFSAPHRDDSWEQLLRRGIRGATAAGIKRKLPSDAELLSPSYLGVSDRAELWLAVSGGQRGKRLKTVVAPVLRLAEDITGQVLVPSLALAFKKPETCMTPTRKLVVGREVAGGGGPDGDRHEYQGVR